MDQAIDNEDDVPTVARGNAPADLHVYSHGRRMSREDRAARTADRLRNSLRQVDEQRLARALGWFSVALGLAEVVMPRQLGRAIGVNTNPNLLRAMGLREIASGVGILTQQQRPGWLWSRVAGDAIDLALLGAAITDNGGKRGRIAAATAAVAGVTALDLYCSQQMSRASLPEARADGGVADAVREMVTVNASPEACYRIWRDFPNFPRFMRNVESVTQTGNGVWHWVVKAPGGGTVEWDSRVTQDEPNRRLAWETMPGAEVQNRGSVQFEPASGGRGTVVQVEMSYVPPAGTLGAVAARLTGDSPAEKVREDLRRFKQIAETGEVSTTTGQPSGGRSAVGRLFGNETRQ